MLNNNYNLSELNKENPNIIWIILILITLICWAFILYPKLNTISKPTSNNSRSINIQEPEIIKEEPDKLPKPKLEIVKEEPDTLPKPKQEIIKEEPDYQPQLETKKKKINENCLNRDKKGNCTNLKTSQ